MRNFLQWSRSILEQLLRKIDSTNSPSLSTGRGGEGKDGKGKGKGKGSGWEVKG